VVVSKSRHPRGRVAMFMLSSAWRWS
jgi:hypothetical protein